MYLALLTPKCTEDRLFHIDDISRGQILIAIKTEISDSIDTAPSEVEVEPTQTINEVRGTNFVQLLFVALVSLQQKRRILSLLNHTRGYYDRQKVICLSIIIILALFVPRLAEKTITFEISMGNAGNCMEGYLPMEAHSDLSALDDDSKFLFNKVWVEFSVF